MINSIILGVSAFSLITIVIITIIAINKKANKVNKSLTVHQSKVNKLACNEEVTKYHVNYIAFRNDGKLIEYEDCYVECYNNYILITTYYNSNPINEIFYTSEYKMTGVTKV